MFENHSKSLILQDFERRSEIQNSHFPSKFTDYPKIHSFPQHSHFPSKASKFIFSLKIHIFTQNSHFSKIHNFLKIHILFSTKVKINILIRSMGPISEEDMNYSMDCYFRQYWRDERLGFTGLKKNTHKLSIDQLSLNVKMLEKIWKPDTYFHNGLSSYLHTITRPNKLLRISEHGDITYSMRYYQL